ncbi:unnamed protein product [Rotaria sp. Silwood2]|nr:unnamed protein product [Rotaria sp. Silwood2]CAF4418422.1 unnamed protein product [Rotaria sp. Silwood2]
MTSMSIVPSFNFSIGETSFQNFNKEQDFFLWYQLLIELLKQLPSTSVSQNNLLAECRLKYFDDTTQLRKIQEFEDTYDSTNVIEWYIRVAFLYRLLNKALRTKNILIIFQFRFVLIDLYNCLAQLHESYISSLRSQKETISELVMFHGQGLTVAELQSLKDNINGRISINSFFFTSTWNEIPLHFAGNALERSLIESIFFEIHCSVKNYLTKPFAYLEKEEKVLFTMGTIFQINFVEKLTDQIWHVKLTLCDDDNDLIRTE